MVSFEGNGESLEDYKREVLSGESRLERVEAALKLPVGMTIKRTRFDREMDEIARDLQRDPVAFYSRKVREEPGYLESLARMIFGRGNRG